MFFDGMGVVGLFWFGLSVASSVAVIVLIVLGIRWLLQNTGSGLHDGSRRPPAEDPALAVLRERFARGEIDATNLSSGGGPSAAEPGARSGALDGPSRQGTPATHPADRRAVRP